MTPTVNGVEVGPNSPAIGLRQARPEDAEEQLCDDHIARLFGTDAVVRFSQAQASQQTRGISDRRYRVYGVGLWFEVKAEDGKLTASQHAFLLAEIAVGQLACCGTLDDLKHVLAQMRPCDDVVEVREGESLHLASPRALCLQIIGRWAAKGYRPEPRRRRRRSAR